MAVPLSSPECARRRSAAQAATGHVLPHILLFGPLVYAIEVAIGVSLMLSIRSRAGALSRHSDQCAEVIWCDCCSGLDRPQS